MKRPSCLIILITIFLGGILILFNLIKSLFNLFRPKSHRINYF